MMSSKDRIRLTSDWRGYLNGETITVNKVVAVALIQQGIGIYANPKPNKMKNVKGAPKDKMLKGASISK